MQAKRSLAEGTILERYHIERVLGSDGFCIVYLVRDPEIERQLVIKEYFPAVLSVRGELGRLLPTGDELAFHEGLTAFLDEGRRLQALDHPHVAQVRRIFEANGTAYLARDYYGERTLGGLLADEGTLPEHSLLAITRPILDALEAVHNAGLLHCNVTPDNIVLTSNGTNAADGVGTGVRGGDMVAPVLVGFGQAKHTLRRRAPRALPRVFTQGFAAPEQYSSEAELGPWTDIYGLAAVMYRCVAGEPPQEANSRSLVNRMPAATELGSHDYSGPLLHAIDRALAIDVATRPQSISGWRNEFNSPARSAKRGRRNGGAIAIAAGALLIAGVSVTLILQRNEPANANPRSNASAVDDATVETLIATTARHIDEQRYTAPAGANALTSLESLLEIAPNEPEALRLKQVVLGTLAARAELALRNEDLPQAESLLVQAERLEPDAAVTRQARAELAATTERAQRLDQLLREANIAMTAERLVGPGDDNAFGLYSQILALDPNHQQASTGLETLFNRLLTRAEEAADRGERDEARAHLRDADRVKPGSPETAALRDRLAADIAASTTEPPAQPPQPFTNPEDADGDRLARLIQKMNADIARDRLASPPGNNALEALEAVRAIDPEHPAIAEGINRIHERYLTLARAAIRDGDREAARRHLDEADFVLPERAETAELRRELATAAVTTTSLQALEPAASAPVAPANARQGNRITADPMADYLALAEQALADDRLSGPDGAVNFFRAALLEDPENRIAQNGLTRVRARYAERIRNALDAEDFDAAEEHLTAAEAIDGEDGTLNDLRARLNTARRADDATVRGALAAPAPLPAIEQELAPLDTPPPEYPSRALRERISGWVRLEFTVAPDGGVSQARVIESQPRRVFDQAALEAVEQWRFRPKIVNNQAVAQRVVQTLQFNPSLR